MVNLCPSLNKQSIRNIFERFAKTSPEIFKEVSFKYSNAWILHNDYAKIWVAANKFIGSYWEWSQKGSLPKSNALIVVLRFFISRAFTSNRNKRSNQHVSFSFLFKNLANWYLYIYKKKYALIKANYFISTESTENNT